MAGFEVSTEGIVSTGTSSPVHDLLNKAWEHFWAAPDNYHAWEREAIAKLKQSASDLGA
jgi:hypothetical protein